MRSGKLFSAMGLIALLVASALGQASNSKPAGERNPVPGSEVCASCHSEIYNSYAKTVMARASGRAGDGLIAGEFDDKESGVRYRVYQRDGHAWMSYEREKEKGFRGERELLYFIGSNKKGRTYLFAEQGFWFETPINWYSQEGKWEMTPAYAEAKEIPMNLPSFSSCLNCHTSGLQPRMPGTRNRYSGEPFAHAGITCERCHGAGEGHVEGKGPIVNPAKLPPERRDSICMECHFEGTVSVQQPGKHVYQFQPGERLADYVHYFLLRGNEPQTAEALSQFEALSLSACKRKSGDKMWCVSCHDPHQEPGPAEKVAYFRGKCLSCHGEGFAAKHHPDKLDCTSCHMPALPSKDVAHTQSTDHRILKYPLGGRVANRSEVNRLEAFPESEGSLVTTRDRALAWEMLAQRGVEGASREAVDYLEKAAKEGANDSAVLSALGFMELQRGYKSEAKDSYERVLKVRPQANTAATNLGILEAQSGNTRRAVELWQGAFERAPYRSEIGMDLAIVFCTAGQKEEARRYVERVLEFNPDYGKAKSLLMHLQGDPVQCRP